MEVYNKYIYKSCEICFTHTHTHTHIYIYVFNLLLYHLSCPGCDKLDAGWPLLNSQQEQEVFLFSLCSERFGAYLVTFPMGPGGSFLRGEAPHSSPSGAKVKNVSTCPHIFTVWCFTFKGKETT
jgi:hypothetical protein